MRADPAVAQLELLLADGTKRGMRLYGDSTVTSIRFGVTLPERTERLQRVVAKDADGAVIAQFDLDAHDESWHRPRPPHTIGGGWVPPNA